MTKEISAAVLLIGDELLSGRTRDINLQSIAEFLAPLGIQVREARIVSDDQDAIISSVNHLRGQYDYVFTTGGIGPTHDDITADAMAAAFGVTLDIRDDAREILNARYDAMGSELTPARLRMARIPDGASLILNPVSGAPGFQLENVFVMAGVPAIVRAMLEDVETRLESGIVVKSGSVRGKGLKEGDLADRLRSVSEDFPELSVGSYPWYASASDSGVNVVIRGSDETKINEALNAVSDLVVQLGVTPEINHPN